MLLELYRDWGAENLFRTGAGDGKEGEGGQNGEGDAASPNHGNGSEAKKENVWRRAGRLPITKSGVREALARIGGNGAAED